MTLPISAGYVELLGLVGGFVGAIILAFSVKAHPGGATHEGVPLAVYFPRWFKVGVGVLLAGFALQIAASSLATVGRHSGDPIDSPSDRVSGQRYSLGHDPGFGATVSIFDSREGRLYLRTLEDNPEGKWVVFDVNEGQQVLAATDDPVQ